MDNFKSTLKTGPPATIRILTHNSKRLRKPWSIPAVAHLTAAVEFPGTIAGAAIIQKHHPHRRRRHHACPLGKVLLFAANNRVQGMAAAKKKKRKAKTKRVGICAV